MNTSIQDQEKVSEYLNEPNMESTTPSVHTLMPVLPCRMSLTLDDVIPYDRNPRIQMNPNYASIKESIRNRGLDDEPTITRRSLNEPLMIRSGGNTRLTILGELYKEYMELAQEAEKSGNLSEAQALKIKANEFYHFEWSYKPWDGETNALIGHMAENEERGAMIFIEKALAVKDLADIFNKEEVKPLSTRKLAEKITKSGWSIGQTSISLMVYTVRELSEKLKKALWAGMGKPQIVKLRALSNAYSTFCTSQLLPTDFFEKTWDEVLIVCDDEELHIEAIRRYADQLISDELGIEYFTVTAEIDAILQGNKPVIRDVPLSQKELNQEPNGTFDALSSEDSQNLQSSTTSGNDSLELSDTISDGSVLNESDAGKITKEQLNELRLKNYSDVMKLAKDFNLSGFINKTQEYGLGFFIDPIKESEIESDIINDPEHLNRNSVWLYLKQLSLHNLFMSSGDMVPVEQTVSGSNLTPDVFFTLNSHFHLMRLTDKNIQNGVNKIEKSIHSLLQTADKFYGENALYQLFENSQIEIV
jgi:ParB family protein of integrating conjugative element (PFGI_1 class)